jgi:VanZ family protein
MRIFAAFMAASVVLLTIAANFGWGGRAFAFLHYVPGRDVTGHFALFALLSFSVVSWLSRPTPTSPGWSQVRITALLAAVVTIEEFSQAFIPARTFSLLDLSASWAGLLAGALVSLRLPGSRPAKGAA